MFNKDAQSQPFLLVTYSKKGRPKFSLRTVTFECINLINCKTYSTKISPLFRDSWKSFGSGSGLRTCPPRTWLIQSLICASNSGSYLASFYKKTVRLLKAKSTNSSQSPYLKCASRQISEIWHATRLVLTNKAMTRDAVTWLHIFKISKFTVQTTQFVWAVSHLIFTYIQIILPRCWKLLSSSMQISIIRNGKQHF